MTSLEDLKNATSPVAQPGHVLPQYQLYADATPSFMEFAPRDPVTQAKYDATSKTWLGAESSSKAVLRGEFSLDSAEKTRNDLKTPQKATPEAQWTCSLQ